MKGEAQRLSYAEAVTYAAALRKRAEAVWLNPAAMGPLGSEALHRLCYWHWRGIPGRRAQMRAALVDLAGRDAKAQEWLRRRIATALEQGEPIPEPFRAWAVAFLRDPARPKGKPGPPFRSTRDELMAYSVAALVKRGLTKAKAIEATGEAWALSPEAATKAVRPKKARRK